MIEVGAQAPDFTLRDAQGNAVSLKDYRGKKVVLYFYPRDNTPFTLLSDPEHTVLEAYGAWGEKKNYGKVSMGTIRSTVVIDENGVVEKVYAKVKPDTHPAEVLSALKGE